MNEVHPVKNAATTSFEVGQRPWGIALMPGGEMAYTANGPSNDVSLVDLTAVVEKPTTPEEVNAAFKRAAQGELKGILDVSDEPLVSVDYIGSRFSSVVDALSTTVIDGTLVHVSSWYDNEMGYSARCVDLLAYIASRR